MTTGMYGFIAMYGVAGIVTALGVLPLTSGVGRKLVAFLFWPIVMLRGE